MPLDLARAPEVPMDEPSAEIVTLEHESNGGIIVTCSSGKGDPGVKSHYATADEALAYAATKLGGAPPEPMGGEGDPEAMLDALPPPPAPPSAMPPTRGAKPPMPKPAY